MAENGPPSTSQSNYPVTPMAAVAPPHHGSNPAPEGTYPNSVGTVPQAAAPIPQAQTMVTLAPLLMQPLFAQNLLQQQGNNSQTMIQNLSQAQRQQNSNVGPVYVPQGNSATGRQTTTTTQNSPPPQNYTKASTPALHDLNAGLQQQGMQGTATNLQWNLLPGYSQHFLAGQEQVTAPTSAMQQPYSMTNEVDQASAFPAGRLSAASETQNAALVAQYGLAAPQPAPTTGEMATYNMAPAAGPHAMAGGPIAQPQGSQQPSYPFQGHLQLNPATATTSPVAPGFMLANQTTPVFYGGNILTPQLQMVAQSNPFLLQNLLSQMAAAPNITTNPALFAGQQMAAQGGRMVIGQQPAAPVPCSTTSASQAAQEQNYGVPSLPRGDRKTLPRPLYMEFDRETLTEYQCLLRKQIELFEAGPEDVKASAQGRNNPILLGQVGIRCRYCAAYPLKCRPRGAIYYSRTIDGLYQVAQNMSKLHFCRTCETIPKDVQSRLGILQKVNRRAAGGKEYWAEGLRVLGVYEDGQVMRFRYSKSDGAEQQSSAAAGAQPGHLSSIAVASEFDASNTMNNESRTMLPGQHLEGDNANGLDPTTGSEDASFDQYSGSTLIEMPPLTTTLPRVAPE